MPQVVQITSNNYNGQTAFVTFYPCSGETPITIGYVTIPYNYEADYYLGTYTLYLPMKLWSWFRHRIGLEALVNIVLI